MKVTATTHDGVVILAVEGLERLDAASAGPLRADLVAAMGGEALRVVIDLSPVRHVDSSGLSLFISLNKTLLGRKGELKLCGLSSPVRSMFELTRLHRVFDIHPDAKAAAASFGR